MARERPNADVAPSKCGVDVNVGLDARLEYLHGLGIGRGPGVGVHQVLEQSGVAEDPGIHRHPIGKI